MQLSLVLIFLLPSINLSAGFFRWKRDDNDILGSIGSMVGGLLNGVVRETSANEENQDRQGGMDKNGKLNFCNMDPKQCQYLDCLAENFRRSPQANTMKEGAKILFNRDMRQALEHDPMVSKIACDKVGLDDFGCKGFRSFLGLIDMIDPDRGDPMRPTQEPPPDSGPNLGSILGGGGIPIVGSLLGGGEDTETTVQTTTTDVEVFPTLTEVSTTSRPTPRTNERPLPTRTGGKSSTGSIGGPHTSSTSTPESVVGIEGNVDVPIDLRHRLVRDAHHSTGRPHVQSTAGSPERKPKPPGSTELKSKPPGSAEGKSKPPGPTAGRSKSPGSSAVKGNSTVGGSGAGRSPDYTDIYENSLGAGAAKPSPSSGAGKPKSPVGSGAGKSPDYTDFYENSMGAGGSGSGSGHKEPEEPAWKPRQCHKEFIGVDVEGSEGLIPVGLGGGGGSTGAGAPID